MDTLKLRENKITAYEELSNVNLSEPGQMLDIFGVRVNPDYANKYLDRKAGTFFMYTQKICGNFTVFI